MVCAQASRVKQEPRTGAVKAEPHVIAVKTEAEAEAAAAAVAVAVAVAPVKPEPKPDRAPAVEPTAVDAAPDPAPVPAPTAAIAPAPPPAITPKRRGRPPKNQAGGAPAATKRATNPAAATGDPAPKRRRRTPEERKAEDDAKAARAQVRAEKRAAREACAERKAAQRAAEEAAAKAAAERKAAQLQKAIDEFSIMFAEEVFEPADDPPPRRTDTERLAAEFPSLAFLGLNSRDDYKGRQCRLHPDHGVTLHSTYQLLPAGCMLHAAKSGVPVSRPSYTCSLHCKPEASAAAAAAVAAAPVQPNATAADPAQMTSQQVVLALAASAIGSPEYMALFQRMKDVDAEFRRTRNWWSACDDSAFAFLEFPVPGSTLVHQGTVGVLAAKGMVDVIHYLTQECKVDCCARHSLFPQENRATFIEPAIVSAIRGRNVDGIKAVLRANSGFIEPSDVGRSTLFDVAFAGCRMLTWLYSEKFMQCMTKNALFSLYYATWSGQLDVFKYLLDLEHDLPRSDKCNTLSDLVFERALTIAAAMGHMHMVKYLVEAQATNPNCPEFDHHEWYHRTVDTPALVVAAVMGHLDVVQYLHGKGASLDRSTSGMCPLALIYALPGGCVACRPGYIYDFDDFSWRRGSWPAFGQSIKAGEREKFLECLSCSRRRLAVVRYLVDNGELAPGCHGVRGLQVRRSHSHLMCRSMMHDLKRRCEQIWQPQKPLECNSVETVA